MGTCQNFVTRQTPTKNALTGTTTPVVAHAGATEGNNETQSGIGQGR
jgi:hypothetical protein